MDDFPNEPSFELRWCTRNLWNVHIRLRWCHLVLTQLKARIGVFLGWSGEKVPHHKKKRLRYYILAANRLFQSENPVIEQVLYLKGRSII